MKLSDVVFVRRKKPVILDPSNYNPQTLRGMEIHVTFIAFPNREKVKETQEGDRYMHRAPTAFGDTVPHVTTPYPYEEITLDEAAKYPILVEWYEEWEDRVWGYAKGAPQPITKQLRDVLEKYAAAS